MDLEGINRAVNPNQMKGQNAIVLAMLARKFSGGRRGYSGGDSSPKNSAEAMKYASDLRLHEEAQKAWIKTQAEERAAKFATENLPEQVAAVREASKIEDEEGNIIGEVAVNSKTHGISTSGYRAPKKAKDDSGTLSDNVAAEQAVADTVAPQARSQQGADIPGWGTPAPQAEPEVTRAQLRSAMARGPKKRVTKKAEQQKQLLFWEPPSAE